MLAHNTYTTVQNIVWAGHKCTLHISLDSRCSLFSPRRSIQCYHTLICSGCYPPDVIYYNDSFRRADTVDWLIEESVRQIQAGYDEYAY